MKISNFGINETGLPLRGTQNNRGRGTSTATASGRTETVAISGAARLAGAAQAALSEVPNVRMERVQPIMDSLERGQYQVNSQETADRILRSALRKE